MAAKKRILVVEDDLHLCALLSDELECAGYRVLCAGTDTEAFDILKGSSGLAALIADIGLGRGTTGFDVARFARQLHPTLPVFYISGLSSPHSFSTFGVPGSEFFEKPFDFQSLVDAVANKVTKRRRRRTSDESHGALD